MREQDIRFVLNNPKAQIPTPLYLKYSCKDGVMRYPLSNKILPSNWNAKKPYIHKPLRDEISLIKADALKYITEQQKSRKDILMMSLYNHLALSQDKPLKAFKFQKKEISTDNKFFAQIQEFIDNGKTGELTIINSGKKNGTRYASGTLRHWKLVKGILQNFDPNMSWNITMDTYSRFITWCNQPDQNYRPLYIGALIKVWKVFMNFGLHFGFHQNHIHQTKAFTKPQEKSFENKVYLSEAEIKKLIDLNLTGARRVIRDAFVFNCYCGLRISDMANLTKADVNNGIIINTNQKTNKRVAIPLHRHNKMLIEKYDGIPMVYHPNTINEFIKLIAKDAGLTAPVKYTQIKGGKVEVIKKEKWELICCHTARRSFTTNLLKYANTIQASKITGMTLPILEVYNRKTVEENAEEAKELAFFQ